MSVKIQTVDKKEEVFEEQWQLHDAEPDFLSASLLDTNTSRKLFVDLNNHIIPSYFKNKNLALIFEIFKVFFNKYNGFPSKSMALSLLKQRIKEEEFESIEKSIDIVYEDKEFREIDVESLRDSVCKFIKENKIKTAIFQSIPEIKKGDFGKIEKKIKDAVLWNDQVNLGIKISDVEERYSKLTEIYKNFVPTPWKKLNARMSGGFFEKQLYIFAGGSSVGKSIALDECANYAWQTGKNVVMITLEMSEEIKGQRIDAANLELSMLKLLDKKDEVVNFYKKINTENGNELRIKEFPTSKTSATDIKQFLYQLRLYDGVKKIDAIFVDYGDIMIPDSGLTGNKYMDDKTVFENLRALGQEEEAPIITGTQFNREALMLSLEELTEKNLADSYWKMRSADTIIGMWNTPELREEGKIYMKMIKNRNGEKECCDEYYINYEWLKIYN